MSHRNCPHCGSQYTTHKNTVNGFEKNTEEHYCESCKKHFTFEIKKQQPSDGEWLFTVTNSENYLDKAELHVHKTDSGYLIKQRKNSDYKTRRVRPTTKINVVQMFGPHYLLWFSTFTYFNDADGIYVTTEKILLNPELTQRALTCEAMRIIHKKDNEFVIQASHDKNQMLINDIKVWFDQILAENNTGSAQTATGGCYVATAVYGSYDCPEVWTLRRFRDNTLASSLLGRAFIRTYYAISPTLVKWFGETRWFKNMWKPSLDKLVKKLRDKGVESTPYNDRNW